ncbi:MAG: hypothetical protein WCL04_05100 [Verrucomicrobiota bacterium]
MIEPRPEGPLTRWDWLAVALVAVGLVLCAFFAPRAIAADLEQATRWQLVECPPDGPCRPRGKTLETSTACDLDAASLAMVAAKATRIKCERVKRDR